MVETQRKPLTQYRGVVISTSGQKTVKVKLEYQARHPKYGKILRRRTIAHVHDEKNQTHPGDIVEICKCRPVSRTKNWRLLRIVEKVKT